MSSNNRFVLIRGLLRETRHWGEFPRLLQQQFRAAEILTPDIPGNGCLHTETSPSTIAAMTDALRKQLDLERPVHLIAISMGGMIAIDWMHRHPNDIQSAVLINTSARPLSPFYQRLRWQAYPQFFKLPFISMPERERCILALTSNRHRDDDTLLKNWQHWQQQHPVRLRSAQNQLWAAARFSLPSCPPHPLLIVASKADRLVDYRCSLRLHRLWRTDYRQHATAGHDLPLDEPDWLCRIIKRWLSQQKT